MSNIPAGYNLIIDVSHHQQRIDYELVARHIRGAIVRFSYGTMLDTLWVSHVNGFLEAGVPVAAYTWFRPDQSIPAQLDVARRQLDATKRRINLVFSDHEQHGWGGYLNLLPHYEQFSLSAMCKNHVLGLQALGVRAGTYSRATWIRDHSRPHVWPMASSSYPFWRPWLYDYPTFLASYPFASGGVITTWERLITEWAPRYFGPYFPSDWPAPRYADIWQWSGDKFKLPGITNNYGNPVALDLGYASDAILTQFVTQGVIPIPTPIPEPSQEETEMIGTYRTLIQGQNLRDKPSTGSDSRIIGTVSAGLTLSNPSKAQDEIGNLHSWRYFQNIPTRSGSTLDGWLAFYHGGTQFLRRES